MNNTILSPKKVLNKAFLKIKTNRTEIEKFKFNLIELIDKINERESEEFHKNLVSDFLKNTYYGNNHYINTKGRNDLVIHNGNTPNTTVGVIVEAKKPTNKTEMIRKENINAKAFQELVLYYLRERITHKNLEIKYLIATNIYEWFVFDANLFEKQFAENKSLVKQFIDFEEGRLAGKNTDFFYKQIAEPAIENIKHEIYFTHFDIRDYEKPLRNNDKTDDNLLIALYKLLSPEHLLKLAFANDSNSLDKTFYTELLHIIGLVETKDGGKKLIQRKNEGERNAGSLLENTIVQLDSHDKISRIPKLSQYGNTYQEQLFNVGLELIITWINRILFLKLLEAQLMAYNKGNKDYMFLDSSKIRDFDDLDKLFFRVLAKKPTDRDESINKLFGLVPYLNSSLFEPTELEHQTLFVSGLEDFIPLPYISSSVIKDATGKRPSEILSTLDYLFSFLNAYDFASEGSEEIQEDNKQLINASVLGLIFEKINGYKDGSFFTPGFITMYICRETIRRTVVQKFNETKGWNCDEFGQLYDKIEDRAEANSIVNSIKICDPAVGSGHFLVSALNEIISIKSELKILSDRHGKRLKEYDVQIENDELIITDDEGAVFEYKPTSKESQRIQETLFHEKQTIIENCLFGVDINPNSVKICRLRLWIELLKNAYYKNDLELETLPNIDINIKCGNSLISRYPLDADIKTALKKSKWSIDSYRLAIMSYRNAANKEQKRELEQLINTIKNDFETEVSTGDKRLLKLNKTKGELMALTTQTTLFGRTKTEQTVWNKQVKSLTETISALELEITDIRNNKIYENAFEWRFEFPEVLNDEGDFVGFDAVIGNPPYIQLSKTEDITKDYKNYLLETYQTSGGRLNTFIFFVHLPNKILDSNGFLHFIIPNTILSQEYYSFTRDFLVNKVSLTEIVNFPILPFEDAVVETVLIQYANRPNLIESIVVKELSKEKITTTSKLQRAVINRDAKYSFVYNLDSIIEKIFEKEHDSFGSICEVNQGIALKGDKSLSLKEDKENENCFKLLDGRNINKYSIKWDGVYLDYYLDRIHSCKRKDIFESAEKLMFRRVSSSLIFTYDNEQYYALNTLVIVNKIDNKVGPNLKFILGLMNSKLMNYVYSNKFKSTKTVFSEIQARSIKELPIPKVTNDFEKKIIGLSDKIISSKKSNMETTELETQIDRLVYQLYELTEEEIGIIENSIK